MALCLFEDLSISTLLPLTHIVPDFDLRCGIFSARERSRDFFPEDEHLFYVRMGLVDAVSQRIGAPVNNPNDEIDLFINGTVLLDRKLVDLLKKHRGQNCVIVSGDVLVACTVADREMRDIFLSWLKAELLRQELAGGGQRRDSLLDGFAERVVYEALTINFPWHPIEYNSRMLRQDAEHFALGTVAETASIASSAVMEGREQLFVCTGAKIGAGCVIDATDGPVVIDEQAVIMPQAVVRGPAYIGKKSCIKVAAKIYEGTSIGPVCKVGGEVEDTIFHSFANKQHDGFTGHSYFAAWTNLGADSNTSDLKNNYSEIRVTLEDREYGTGSKFLGTVMADHSKCGINTMFNTGSSVGVGCNIYGGDFPPKYLPSFSWGGAGGLQEYDFERFCATAEMVMSRRGQTLTEVEKSLLRDVFVHTSKQRVSSKQHSSRQQENQGNETP